MNEFNINFKFDYIADFKNEITVEIEINKYYDYIEEGGEQE